MSDDKQQQDLATQIKNHHRSGEFDEALEISKGALKSDPPDLKLTMLDGDSSPKCCQKKTQRR